MYRNQLTSENINQVDRDAITGQISNESIEMIIDGTQRQLSTEDSTENRGIDQVIDNPSRVFNRNYSDEAEALSDLFPFSGRKNLVGFVLDADYLWDIQIAPYVHNVGGTVTPALPTRYNEWLPAVSYTLDDNRIKTEDIAMYGESNIDVPAERVYNKSIRISVIDDENKTFYRYRAQYLEAIATRDGFACPYKNCCTQITLYVFRNDRRVLLKKVYLGILLDNLNTNLTGQSGATSNITYDLNYRIVGEITDSPEKDLEQYEYDRTQSIIDV